MTNDWARNTGHGHGSRARSSNAVCRPPSPVLIITSTDTDTNCERNGFWATAHCVARHDGGVFYPRRSFGRNRVAGGTKVTNMSMPTSTRKNGNMPRAISSILRPLMDEPTNRE